MRSILFSAVAVLGLGIAPAFAAADTGTSGYAYPGFWGRQQAQQVPNSAGANKADGPAIHAYATHTDDGIWLFPPDPYGGGDN
jgi:hypothetical protein